MNKKEDDNYIITYNDIVYKKLPTHYLKLSPWENDEDRRVYELDNTSYRMITYKNACMVINKQFDEAREEWEHNGKRYTADPIGTTDVEKHASLIKLLPSHSVRLQSEKLLKTVGDSNSLSIQSNDGLSELKMIKHKGKIYYILIVNEDLPRVRAYNMFGEFLQWCNIKHCKPIYSITDKKFI
jgi:hypothetical protein